MAEQIPLTQAPEFALTDTNGNLVRLADYRGRRHVLLALTRGVF